MESVATRLQLGVQQLGAVLDPFRTVRSASDVPLWRGKIGSVQLEFVPHHFYVQGMVIVLAILYAINSYIGRWRNRQAVRAFTEVYTEALREEFALVGAGDDTVLVWNGAADAMLFASGRRGVDTLQATFKLSPRHDWIQSIGFPLYDILWLPATPTQVQDRVTLTFRLPRNEKQALGTFALIDKHALQRVRHKRYDLLFAKVADGDNASSARSLTEQMAIASENGDLTDRFLGEAGSRGDQQRKQLGLVEAMNGPGGRFVESFVVTDQPEVRPVSANIPSVDRIALTMRLPRTKSEAQQTLPVLAAVLDVVDALWLASNGRNSLLQLRPETQASLKKTRNEIAKVLEAEVLEGLEKDEKEDRDEARRKAQQEKFSKMTPAEQAKRKQVEKRRAQRKMQQSQTVRQR
ncbi:hypothetical protein MPSI1_002451 [Malassezia psittaci]|uniref:DUF1682-domain-containing protein n=1 Tax=Malassezia psittaci TaxID=1821823 RepID=A0AAF0FAN0_9BASI|nr:hypothetical protein MPSI1_002451 [Malassezia psittaci]